MSGIIGSKINIRGSGVVAQLGTDGQILTSSGAGVAATYEDISAGISWQSVVTGSTLTAVAGNGYWINTTSNACTITLPSSASAGDTIILGDYSRNWGTNKITIDTNGLTYQGYVTNVEYTTDGLAVGITYMDATQGWVPTFDDAVADVPTKGNSEGIFAYGYSGSIVSMSNLISTVGVVGSDVTGVGTARYDLAACEFGGDKGIFAYGSAGAMSNLVSNSGVIATDVSGVGTARESPAACSYGGDKGIFGYGAGPVSMTNLVNNSGVVGSDVTGVGTARRLLGACEYDDDKAIFAYGDTGSVSSLSNLVSNAGVVATDVTGVGTARKQLAACTYGYDKGIFAYGSTGSNVSMSNLVSTSGVIASDVTGVGSARHELAATQYGGDKAIFGYGYTSGRVSLSNLVSNAGVVATDTTGVGTARNVLAACSYN